jgi:hypothetical protein
MNERIRELAEQARQYYLTLPTGYDPEKIGMYPQLMEKFAELIIQECVSICKDREVEVAIKEHFGVNNDDKG